MGLTPGARCGRHPDAAAVDVCARCGQFVCDGCAELDGANVYCAECFARRAAVENPSKRAMASLLLGIVGLSFGFLPGILGLVLATKELHAIERGEANPTSKPIASAGQILGYLNIALLLAAVGLAAAYG